MAPVFFKNKLLSLDKPLDKGRRLRGKEILGPHKTIRGIIASLLVGTITFYFQQVINIDSMIIYSEYNLLFGFLLSSGAIFGDLVKSFFKRRMNIPAGTPMYLADQLDAVIGAMLFTSWIMDYSLAQVGLIIALTLIIKIIANHIGFYLKIREVKW